MTSQLTPLQFAVLVSINGRTTGKAIRKHLAAKYHISRSLPGFYQLMSRLENDGLVKGDYRRKVIDGQPIKERVYVRTGKGEKALKATQEFYFV